MMFLTGQIAPYWFYSITNRLLFLLNLYRCLRLPSFTSLRSRKKHTDEDYKSTDRLLYVTDTSYASFTKTTKETTNSALSFLFCCLFFFDIRWTVCCAMTLYMFTCICVVQLEKPCVVHFLLQTNRAHKQCAMRMRRKGNCFYVWNSYVCVRVCVCEYSDSGVDRSRSFSLDRSLSLFIYKCVLFRLPILSHIHTSHIFVSSFHFTVHFSSDFQH